MGGTPESVRGITMNRIAAVIAGLSLAFVGSSATIAGTINVPSDQPTIAAAINAAVTGDVINIAAGTYNEHSLNPDGKAITIQGTVNGDGTLATTIDGQIGGSVFVFNGGETSGTVIQNLIMTGGRSNFGGGIDCRNNSNPTISGCTITGNTANNDGGGIFCSQSSPAISDCTISGNTASWGAGIYCDNNSSPTISGCTVEGNDSTNGGGGIYCVSSNPTISDCHITGNTADDAGGILCYLSNPTISSCTITDNTVNYPGGGIYCGDSNPTISDCTITGNSAGWDGGGIWVYGGNPTISGCTITGNTAIAGGGIYCFVSNPTISSCTITGNTASNSGGGMYVFGNSNPTISGGTVCGNTPNQIAGPYTAGQPEPVIAPSCPPPTGACCLGGTCMIGTQSDCAAAGGTYGGDGVACADANCATTTPGDVDGDGAIDVNDLDSLHALLSICPHDIDHDGDTDVEDLLLFLAGYGTTCP